MEWGILAAAANSHVDGVEALLRGNPGLIHLENKAKWTAFHYASWNGRTGVVKLLLAHPVIDVNLQASSGRTPFSLASRNGWVPIVRMMLNDPRVDITFPDNEGCTPLWRASSEGRHHVVKWLIASGKDLGDLNKTGKYWDSNEYTAIEAARNAYIENKTETISLLENLMANPIQTGHQIRVEQGSSHSASVCLCLRKISFHHSLPSFLPSFFFPLARLLEVAKEKKEEELNSTVPVNLKEACVI